MKGVQHMYLLIILIASSAYILGLLTGIQPELQPEVIGMITYAIVVSIVASLLVKKWRYPHGKR